MQMKLAPFYALRIFALCVVLAFFAAPTLAQSQAIQPCEATPSPAKPTSLSAATKVDVKASQTVIDSSIVPDPSIEKLIAPYAEKVKELGLVIGTLDGELQTGGPGASTMGHFVTNAMMVAARAKLGGRVDAVVTNGAGMRKNLIQPGPLKVWDIFELLPFENALVAVDLTGAQLITVFQRVTASRDAEAGARIEFKWNEQSHAELIGAKLIDASGQGREIDKAKTYTIVTIDYLMKLASGNYAILQDGKNIRPLNITIRDAVIDYVKAETAAGRHIQARLDGRFVQIGPDPVKTEPRPND